MARRAVRTTVPTNCVHGSVHARPWTTVVCLNKIMPAGEHMAVQNFITSFMAFQRYDDSDCRAGAVGGGVAGVGLDWAGLGWFRWPARPCANIY